VILGVHDAARTGAGDPASGARANHIDRSGDQESVGTRSMSH
jgi:hypothetical protein